MAAIELELVLGVGSMLSIVGLVVEHFHYQAQLQERVRAAEEQLKTMTNITTDVAEIKTKVELFWGALETQLPPLLLKGNPIKESSELFNLLSRYTENSLMPEETERLICLLEEETQNVEHRPGERLAMVLLEATIRAKLQEKSPCSQLTSLLQPTS